MIIRPSLPERRDIVARLTRGLTQKRSALTENELQQLRELRNEMDFLESDLRVNERRKYARAFNNWLRNGFERSEKVIFNNSNATAFNMPGVSTEDRELLSRWQQEHRDMTTGGQGAYPGTTAGFFAPVEFSGRVESAMSYVGPMMDLATIWHTEHGAPAAYPTDNDTTTSGELVAEDTQVTDVDVAALSSTVFKTYKYSSKEIKVSLELLQDAGFDLESYLVERFGIRLGRALNPAFTTGAGGGNAPTGFITTVLSRGGMIQAVGAGANDGTSSTNTIGTADCAALEASLDVAYRKNAVWMAHPTTLQSMRRLTDKQGLPLYPGLHHGGEDTIFNRPVVLSPWMDAVQSEPSSPPATKNVLAFGDFSKYVVRYPAPRVLRLSNKYADFAQVAFIMFMRADGALVDGGGGAVKILQTVY